MNKFAKRIIVLMLPAFLISTVVFGSTGIEKILLPSLIEVKQLQKDLVQIKGNFLSEAKEHYIIEKSLDNINFKTITIIFPVTEEDNIKSPVLLKDKTTGVKTVYFRVKKVVDNVAVCFTTVPFTFK